MKVKRKKLKYVLKLLTEQSDVNDMCDYKPTADLRIAINVLKELLND